LIQKLKNEFNYEDLYQQINPRDPGDFRDVTLAGVEAQGDMIWEAVVGYYPYTLADFFPEGASPTQIYKNFETDFFDK
jgi:hypothetical protein